MARVTLLYFASVREAVGFAEEQRDIPGDVATVRDLMTWLARLGAGHERAFAAPDKLRCAIDQGMVSFDAPLERAQEVAFFPPVTGG